MNIYRHHPRKGDAVWVEGEPKPNGFILHVDWQDREVEVKLYNTPGSKFIPLDSFYGSRVGNNKWMLEEEYFPGVPMSEIRMDVHVLFDLTDEKNTARLLYLSKYFNYKDGRYAAGSRQRRDKLATLIAKHGVDNVEVARLMGIFHVSRAISARLAQSRR